jgi:hypothetical protein
MALNTGIFKIPDNAAARLSMECSAMSDKPLGVLAADPLLVALKTLAVTQKTIGDCLGITGNIVGKWNSGVSAIPPARKAQLRDLLAIAIENTEHAVEEVRALPESPDRERLIAVLQGRIAAARQALPQNP